jgi:hypothetical protein
VDVTDRSVGLGQQQLGGDVAKPLARLADRAQRYGGGTGEVDVVVADDRQLTRHVDARLGHVLEQPDGDEVVGAKDGGRAPPPRPAKQHLAGSSAFRHGQSDRLDHGEIVRIATGSGQRLAGSEQPVSDAHRVHRAADEGDPPVTVVEQVVDGELATTDVVNSGTAPIRARRGADENDGHASAAKLFEVLSERVERADEHPAHSLLKQHLEVVRLA